MNSVQHVALSRFLVFAAGSILGVVGICLSASSLLPPTGTGPGSAEPVKGILPGAHRKGGWHAMGSSLLDDEGKAVRIVGLNWSGFETASGVPGGLRDRDYKDILTQIRDDGFNVVRLPFSNETVESVKLPSGIGYRGQRGSINEELRGQSSLKVLDKVVLYAQAIGLKIILDNHRSDAGSGPQENGLWFTPAYPESAWLKDWIDLANRYARSSSVVGFDLRNEPHSLDGDGHGACWDCGGERDWHLAAQRAGDAILKVNPNLLIVVEGVGEYRGDWYWWGGNLEGVRTAPVKLELPNHLVYSAHEYGPEEYRQPWFTPTTSAQDLEQTWIKHWGFIDELQIAPLYIGEFGTTNAPIAIESREPGSQGQWFSTLAAFVSKHPHIGWSYWAANGDDRYAYFDRDFLLDHSAPAKMSLLDRMKGPHEPGTKPSGRDVPIHEPSPLREK